MDELLRAFPLLNVGPGDGNGSADGEEQDTEMLVAKGVSLETWNRFAERNTLPHRLRVRQLVWDAGRVLVVEYPLSVGHEIAISRIQHSFCDAFEDLGENVGYTNFRGPGLPTYSPDYAFVPVPGIIPGTQFPAGGATVIAEVMRNQRWASVRPKLQMYRQLEGVQYVFLVKMCPVMRRWSYELHDVGNNNSPANPATAEQHSFDISESNAPVNHEHLVRFDSKRVLGLPQDAHLPREIPDQVVVDLVALAQRARLMARTRGENVAP